MKPFALCLGFVVYALSAGFGRAADCYVLSAGVDNYPHANKLHGCLNDARNTAAAFRAQKGLLFGAVHSHTLLDGDATVGNLRTQLDNIARTGAAGDFVVLFLSGHGGRFNSNRSWYFLPFDYDAKDPATRLTDRELLAAADVFVRQGKKVVIIIDACFSGQLRAAAQDYLAKYDDPRGGGLILLLSSGAAQTSQALGDFSAFAKAFADAMNGNADLNGDGQITLQEIGSYAFERTHQLIREHRNGADKGGKKTPDQDSEAAWSPSIGDSLPLAVVERFRTWSGSESLANFGKLALHFYASGRVVMIDTKSSTEGNWQLQGSDIRLQFFGGRVIYSGTLTGNAMAGTARNEKTSWSWNVQAQ